MGLRVVVLALHGGSTPVDLPLADISPTFHALRRIQEKIFCVSGGLSPDLADFDCIRKLERPCIVPDGGLLCDLMWSDPHPEAGWVEPVAFPLSIDFCFFHSRRHWL